MHNISMNENFDVAQRSSSFISPTQLVENYLDDNDWRIKENSNVSKTIGGLILYQSGAISSAYWLDKVYDKEIASAHRGADFHIHDLSFLGPYCAGWDIGEVLEKGLNGVRNKVQSLPPKHLNTACHILVNFLGIMQNEWAGAQALNNFDTYLAPFVKKDNCSKTEVKQAIQTFLFGINTPSRWGSQAPFSNITLDFTPPEDLKNNNPKISGKLMSFTYGDCQKEMDLINECLFEELDHGDGFHGIFQYPVITINVEKNFRWDSPVTDRMFKLTTKQGTPYFSNFINTEMSSADIRSMCCRLRLNLAELRRNSTGGLFGSGSKTGSIGVVTLNMPRIGYLSKSEEEFFARLSRLMELASRSLEIKRVFCEHMLINNMSPYSKEYLGTFDNHFSTIGVVGMHECCLNFLKKGIETAEGKEFSIKVLNFMKEKLSVFQEATSHLYNLESTPAESTAYRLAKKDKEKYPEIIVSGELNAMPYYTNSSNLPVGYTSDPWEAIRHQEDLQLCYTGGTVLHLFNDGEVKDYTKVKSFIRNVLTNSTLPYITYSCNIRVCPKHGILENYDNGSTICPFCDEEARNNYKKKLIEIESKKAALLAQPN
jgi:ribonucleoside-triphosphate reductase